MPTILFVMKYPLHRKENLKAKFDGQLAAARALGWDAYCIGWDAHGGYVVAAGAMGGLLVGLGQRYLGDHPPTLNEAMAEFGQTRRIEYRHLPQAVAMSLTSLIFGASLGPESGLLDLAGGPGTRAGDRLKASARDAQALTLAGITASVGAFFESPFGGAVIPVEPTDDERPSAHGLLLPGLFAAAAGLVTLHLTLGQLERLAEFPAYHRTPGLDLLAAVPLGLMGAAAGGLCLGCQRACARLMQPLARHPVWRGLLGGVLLGLLGMALPFTFFSGEHQLREVVAPADAAALGTAVLALSALAKLAGVGLCLAAGFKGGTIFPILFTGAALGMAAHQAMPALEPMVAVAAVMAAAATVVLRRPLVVILLLAVLLPLPVLAVVSVGAGVGAGAGRLVARRRA